MSYVKKADLTIDYLIARAFQLGAVSVAQDIRPGHHKQIITTWENGEVIGFPMEDYELNGWQMSFADNLQSMRRILENQRAYMNMKGNN